MQEERGKIRGNLNKPISIMKTKPMSAVLTLCTVKMVRNESRKQTYVRDYLIAF